MRKIPLWLLLALIAFPIIVGMLYGVSVLLGIQFWRPVYIANGVGIVIVVIVIISYLVKLLGGNNV